MTLELMAIIAATITLGGLILTQSGAAELQSANLPTNNGRLEIAPESKGQCSIRSAPVCIPAVGDADNQHDEERFAHLVDHTVIYDAKPAEAPQFTLQRVAEERIPCQTIDGCDDPASVRLGDPLQLLGRRGLNPYREDHA